MACDDCDKCKALGYKFCIKCGESFMETAQVPEYRVHGKNGPSNMLDAIVLPMTVFMIMAIILSLFIVITNFGLGMRFITDNPQAIYLFLPFYVKIGTVSGVAAQAYWSFIGVVMIASCLLVLYDSRDLFRLNNENYLRDSKKTPLYIIGLLLGGTLMIEAIITVIMIAAGVDIKVPETLLNMELPEALFLFTEAGVWEEIAFRLVLFGVPMAIIAAGAGRRDCLKFLFGGFGMSKAALVFLIISSVIFASAHGGWGSWKIITIFPGALMMGYAFARFGLHASIAVHVLNDYIAGLWTVYMPDLATVLFMIFIILGLLCIPSLLSMTFDGLKNIKKLPSTGMVDDQEDA